MLANERLDPRLVREAEATAAREYGDDWNKPKPLVEHLAGMIDEPEPSNEREDYGWDERTYQGFQWWHILLATPNLEKRSAEILDRKHVWVYLPQFLKKVKSRGGKVSMWITRCVTE